MFGSLERGFSPKARLCPWGSTFPKSLIFLELKGRGFDVSDGIYTVDAAAAEIEKI